jgi:hypothetical protein
MCCNQVATLTVDETSSFTSAAARNEVKLALQSLKSFKFPNKGFASNFGEMALWLSRASSHAGLGRRG